MGFVDAAFVAGATDSHTCAICMQLLENPVIACDEGHTFCYCLLYTSPSPRDATLSRMPSSA